jgi:hypothetical protein
MLLDMQYFLYYGETEEGLDPVGRTIYTPMGKGLMFYKREKRFYEGWLSQGGHLNGLCRSICQTSMTVYEGEYLIDEIHGKGYQRWLNEGAEYIGDYVKGNREGFGIYRYANGDRYEGEWFNN